MTTNEYKSILKLAIANEVEAYEFYLNAANKSKNANLKATFTELAEEEKKHKITLEAFLNNETKQMQFKETADYKISESIELPKLTSEMSFADGLALAMKKEEEAMKRYEEFANASDNESQKELFMQLAIMEKGHKTRLEDIYSSTAHTEVW
jgi:rubrerythrin